MITSHRKHFLVVAFVVMLKKKILLNFDFGTNLEKERDNDEHKNS